MDQQHSSSIREAFNVAAAKVAIDFPAALHHFVAVTEDDVVFVSPDLSQQNLNERDFGYLREIFVDDLKQDEDLKACGFVDRHPDLGHVKAIGMKMAQHKISDAEFWWNFDHEVGHLVVPNGLGHDCLFLAEATAETYAALRHVQRYGAEDDYIQRVNLARVENLVGGGDWWIYYYHPQMLDKVDELKQQCDLSLLTPRETVELTMQIVDQCAWNDQTRDKIQSAALGIQKESGIAGKGELKALYHTEKDPDVVRFYQDVLAALYPEAKPSHRPAAQQLMRNGV